MHAHDRTWENRHNVLEFIRSDTDPTKYYASPDGQFTYVGIKKSGSTAFTAIFNEAWEWPEHSTPPHHSRAIAFIREPIDRWCAGIAQVYWNPPMEFLMDHIMGGDVDWFLDNPYQDQHTKPQSACLDRCPREGDIIVKLEHSNRAWGQLKHFGYPIPNLMERNRNSSITRPRRLQLYTKLKELLAQNPKYVEKLKEFYEPDIRLFELAE